MQFFTKTCIAAAYVLLATSASAEVKVSVKQKNYDISGASGTALLDAMDRRGPKHGFLTRAIAQTGYTVGWEIEWAMANGTCRVKNARADLAITYTFPRVTNRLTPELNRRWTKFIKGVRKHEEMHGKLARQMVRAAEREVSGMTMRNDPHCSKSRSIVKRKVAAIYAEYEARQVQFDSKEHRDGGQVEGLVDALVRKR
jgi:predicted secreted Zn-dependent protease